MFGKLVPCGGGPPTILTKTKLLVGRKPDCDVIMVCPSISGRHCLLEFIEGAWWVRDLESKNGTSVNGHRSEKLRIAPKDILAIGRQRLVVEYQPLSKSTAPSKAAAAVKPTAPAKSSSAVSDEDLAFDFLNQPVAAASSSKADVPASTAQVSRPAPPPVAPVSTAAPAPAPSHKPTSDLGRLVPCGGGAPIPLRYPALVLGRSPECDISLRFPSISSRHCKLDFADGYWLVEDLNSTNGTWVDGDRCMYQCLLPDSILALHKYRYTIHYVPNGDGEPPVVKRLFSQSLLEKAGFGKDLADDRLLGQLPLEENPDLPKRYNLLEDE